MLRGAIYYARIRVPDDLVTLIGRRELKASLGTRQLPEAKRRLRQWLTMVQHHFVEARMATLTRQLATKYAYTNLDHRLDQQELRRITQGTVRSDVTSALVTMHKCYQAMNTYSLINNHLDDGAYQAQDILMEKGHQVEEIDPEGVEFLAACREVIKTNKVYHSIEVERLNGNYNNDYDRILEQVAISFQNRRNANSMNEMAKGGNITTLIDLYVRDKSSEWEPRTKNKQKYSLAMFVRLTGDKDVKECLLEDFIKYKETLALVPPNADRAKQLKHRDLLELIAENKCDVDAGRPPRHTVLNRTTQGDYLQHVTWFFNWLVEKSYLLQTYASKLCYSEKSLNRENVKPHETSELQDIINRLPIQAAKPAQLFIPLFGLFAATRLNEVCQPLVRDVGIDPKSGLLCLMINNDKTVGQRVKNLTSRRTIPIPPLLLDLGFQNYWEVMKKEQEKDPQNPLLLFPELRLSVNGYTGAMSNWWSRFIDSEVTKDDAVDFRSLRTNLINELDNRGYSETQIQPLVGHATKSTLAKHYIYKKPDKMFEMLKSVDYGIDLSRLYRESPWITASVRERFLKDGGAGRSFTN
jgi:integrase